MTSPGGWNEIVCKDGSDEWLETCNTALREVKKETLGQAIRRLHKRLDDLPAIAAPQDDALIRGLYEAIDILSDWQGTL